MNVSEYAEKHSLSVDDVKAANAEFGKPAHPEAEVDEAEMNAHFGIKVRTPAKRRPKAAAPVVEDVPEDDVDVDEEPVVAAPKRRILGKVEPGKRVYLVRIFGKERRDYLAHGHDESQAIAEVYKADQQLATSSVSVNATASLYVEGQE